MFLLSAMPRRTKISFLLALQLFFAGALLAFPFPNGHGDSKDSAQLTPAISSSVELLTPSQGADFMGYMSRMIRAVRRNWFELMPDSARKGEKGRVVLRLQIQKDGTLWSQTPAVETSSGNESLDRAAVAAIRSSAPFEHFPEAFHGPNIELGITFLYDLPPAPPSNPPASVPKAP